MSTWGVNKREGRTGLAAFAYMPHFIWRHQVGIPAPHLTKWKKSFGCLSPDLHFSKYNNMSRVILFMSENRVPGSY